MSKKLFISHSTKDDAQVDRIADVLEKAGFTVWVDHRHGIEPGAPNWDKAIRDAIVEADAGIFLMSERSLASDICSAECLLVRELGDPLYVMRLEACKPEDIWLYIKQIQYADLVKDFDRGINELIRVLGSETSEELPKAVRAAFTGLDTMRLHLPYLNNPLRGRDEDIKQIQSKLGAHVLQIVGPGGLGKSRLAAEIAINQPDGAIWHRCSPVSEPADLVALLREHLKLPADASLTNVLAALSEKKPLIVVDNAEDVPDGSDKRRAYADLLQQIVGRGVPVLLTTRAVWTELKPRHDYAPAAVSLETAAQIALDFAAAEDVKLSESQAGELAEKARLHPRLIEFAVGQLHNDETDLETILRRLSELKHDSIQDALDEMITKTVTQMAAQARHGADAEALLRHLTILQGTFSAEAIKALAPKTMKNEDDLLDARATLQKWQFLRRDPNTKRFSLAELVREALGQPGDEVFWAYAEFYTKRAGETFELPPEQWKEHEHDLPNILMLGDALVERMLDGIRLNEAQSDADKKLAALLFAWHTGRFVADRLEYHRLAWLEMGLNAARYTAEKGFEAYFLNQLGLVWNVLGEKRKALAYHENALLLRRAAGDISGEATTLNNIGAIWDDLGEKRKALDYYEQALPLYRAVEDSGGGATVLNNIGFIFYGLRQAQKALDYYEQALSLRRTAGDRGGEATTLNNIGNIWDDLGEKPKALGYYEQALPLYRTVGDRVGEATTLYNFGNVWCGLKEAHKGIAYYEQALSLYQALGVRVGEANTLNNIGFAWFALGESQKALGYYEQALSLYRKIGDHGAEAATLNNIGHIWDALGEQRKALVYYEQALLLRRVVRDRDGEAVTLTSISNVWFGLKEMRKALLYLEQALSLYHVLGDHVKEAITCFNIGAAYASLQDIDQAITYISQCVELEEQAQHPNLERDQQILRSLIRKRDEARGS